MPDCRPKLAAQLTQIQGGGEPITFIISEADSKLQPEKHNNGSNTKQQLQTTGATSDDAKARYLIPNTGGLLRKFAAGHLAELRLINGDRVTRSFSFQDGCHQV